MTYQNKHCRPNVGMLIEGDDGIVLCVLKEA